MLDLDKQKFIFRPYQKEVFDQIVKHKKWLNYMDMGLGKTLVSLAAVEELESFPCVIICPKFALYVWEEEIRKWFGKFSTVYSGKPKQRQQQWRDFNIDGNQYIITNYALCEEVFNHFEEVGLQVGAIIADEIHNAGLFNHKTKTHKVIYRAAKTVPVIIQQTGTPYRQGCVDFFGPLNINKREVFKSYWQYVNRYCITIKEMYGTSIERNPRNIPQFRNMIRQNASILKKTDVLKDLPGKQRVPVVVEMDAEQQRVYDEITEQLFTVTDDGEILLVSGHLPLQMRQRQILTCPQVLGLKTRGAALNNMMEMSADLIEHNEPIVVFTPFKKAVPFIEQAYMEDYPDMNVYKITGGLSAEEFRDAWQGFQKDRKKRKLLICVIKSSAAFHATESCNCFFLGYEWDFNLNDQAEDRLNRIGQSNFVTCRYFLYKGDYADSQVVNKLNDKQHGANWILGSNEMFKQMLAKVQCNHKLNK